MRLDDALRDLECSPPVRGAEVDALRHDWAMTETVLVSTSFDAVRSRAVLVFDTRASLQLYDVGSTAAVVVHGVREMSWSSARPDLSSGGAPARAAWTTLGWVVSRTPTTWRVEAALHDGRRLVLEGSSAEFVVGWSTTVGPVPASYPDDSDEAVDRQNPSLDSEFSIAYRTTSAPEQSR